MNSALQEIDLSENLGSEGLKWIFEAIQENVTLKKMLKKPYILLIFFLKNFFFSRD
jgi:hypothetical protein